MVWLSVGLATESCAAALEKLRRSATAAKAFNSANWIPRIPLARAKSSPYQNLDGDMAILWQFANTPGRSSKHRRRETSTALFTSGKQAVRLRAILKCRSSNHLPCAAAAAGGRYDSSAM